MTLEGRSPTNAGIVALPTDRQRSKTWLRVPGGPPARFAQACENQMTTALTIAELERAINYRCARQTSSENGALCAKAHHL